ncbi:hypothetical protein [Sphingopyxis sp. GW247-27LB]|uniref:hypothetical protein n=1 Tax=Sphingopyxis sp. GW247-27LB TaxID=2012632 RepID=UPI000BA6662E|nr:hypothetical protein [Sphingopyxis sp. GW247-27LB]PAL22410.1 hypothetical protein CD928_09920 [Sphingopyxis sp. GW247-27LB]
MSDDTPPIRSIEEVHGCYRTGTVCGVGNWSETRVHASSSGGGGYLHNGSGHVSAPTVSVSSTSTEVLRFFMEYDDDDEEEVTIKGGGFAVREGQRVSVIRVSSRPNWGYNIAYHNHKTGTTYAPDYRLEWPLDKKPSRKPALFAAILIATLGSFVLFFLAPVIALGVFIWGLYSYGQKMRGHRELTAAVRRKADEMIAEAKAGHARSRDGAAIEGASVGGEGPAIAAPVVAAAAGSGAATPSGPAAANHSGRS